MVVGVVVAVVVAAVAVVVVALKVLLLLVWEALERGPPVEQAGVVEGVAPVLQTMRQVVADPCLVLLLLQ